MMMVDGNKNTTARIAAMATLGGAVIAGAVALIIHFSPQGPHQPSAPPTNINIQGDQNNITAGDNATVVQGDQHVTRIVASEAVAEALLKSLEGLADKDAELRGKDQEIAELKQLVEDLRAQGTERAAEAEAALARGETEKAEALFRQQAEQLETKGQEALKAAATAYLNEGLLAAYDDTDGARTAFQKAVDLNPDNARAWNQLALMERRLGNTEKAEKAYEKIIALSEKSDNRVYEAVALGNLGTVAQIRGDFGKAEEFYRRAYEIDEALGRTSSVAATLGNLGLLVSNLGRLEEAESYLLRALRIYEDIGEQEEVASSHINLGLIAWQRNSLDKAEQHLELGLEISESLGSLDRVASSHGNLGNIAYLRGNVEKAEDHHLRSLQINKQLGRERGIATDQTNLGLIAYKRGDFPAACAQWQQAIATFRKIGMKPQYFQTWNLMRRVGCDDISQQ